MKTENKQLTVNRSPQNEEISTLQRVDLTTVVDDNILEVGRLESDLLHQQFSELMVATRLAKIKREKSYKAVGFSTWDAFIAAKCRISLATADRLIDDLKKLGTGWFELREVARISREVFAAVNPEFKDGHVLIAGERFKLTPSNAAAIQEAFEKCRVESSLARQQASATKLDLEKARGERDSLKKANENLTNEIRDAKSPKAFADADEDLRVMLGIQSEFDKLTLLLAKLRDRELSVRNRSNYLLLAHHMHRALLHNLDAAQVNFESELDPPDPSIRLHLNDEPDKGGDLIGNYIKKLRGK